jgi:hypothetical protein
MESKLIKKCINGSLILGWVSIWFSITFNPKLLLTINFQNLNVLNMLEYLRGLSQIILFIYLLLLITYLLLKKKICLKNQIINLIFISIFILQIVGFILTDNSLLNFYYNICAINVVLICLIISTQLKNKILIKMFYISIIFLILIFLFFIKDYIWLTIKTPLDFYSVWSQVIALHENISVPRPTGLARTAFILIIFFSIYSLDNRKFEIYIKIVLSILGFFVFLLSSRTIVFCLVIYLIFFNYHFYKRDVKKIIENFMLYIFIPLIFIKLISFSFQSQSFNSQQSQSFNKKKITRNYSNLRDFSSGRLDDWKKIIKTNKNFIFGNGSMGDRYLINQTASNIFLNIYASNGIVGLILLLYLKLIIIKKIYYFFKLKKKENDYKHIKLISLLLLTFFMMRSILETSYGIFGIDFILFCLASNLITLNYNK